MIEKIKILFQFFADLWHNRSMLLQLVRNDLKARYAGSAFGMVWAFVQPLVNMLVMWFVFQVGFRSSPVDDIEFILWYLAAYIPWLFYSDGITAASNCLYEYGYLVKKMRFRTSMLPIVKVLSAGFIHLFFMFFAVFMFELHGYAPQWAWLQIIYYSFAAFCLMLGLSWLVASISVFFKDFSQLVTIILGIQFWVTPIFWSPQNINDSMLTIFKLNPMYYVVNGYRDSLISGLPFWHDMKLTVYFWCVAAALFLVGSLIYNRLRPHFADLI